MRSILFTVGLLLCWVAADGQGWNWGKCSAGGGVEGWAVATDGLGNVYGAGFSFTSGTISFGSGVTAPIYTGSSYGLIWVKYDNSGTPLWAGGTTAGDCYLNNICTDASGNLFVFGTFTSHTMTIGTTTLTNAGSGANYFIAKIDPSGTLIWAINDGNVIPNYIIVIGVVTTGVTPYELTTGQIVVDASGDIYIMTSYSAHTMTIGSTTLTNAGGNDIVVAKYTSAGTPVWATSVGGAGNEYGFGMTLSSTGNIYVCGDTYSSTATIGSSVISNPYSGKPAVLLAEFSPAGTPLWAQASGGPKGAFASALSSDVYGNIYMTGGFGDTTITFGSSTFTRVYPDAVPQLALFLVQYSSSNVVTWGKTIGSRTKPVWGYSVARASCDQVWVSGNYTDTIAIDTARLPLLNGLPSPDPLFIAGYDLAGGVVSCVGLGSGGDDQCNIASDGYGNVYICGDYQGGMLKVGADTLSSTGSEVFYLASYAGCSDALAVHTTVPTSPVISLFPNPANDEVTIRSDVSFLQGSVVIYDFTGRVAGRYPLAGNATTIPLAGFSPGIYDCVIYNNGTFMDSKKLSVTR